MQIKKLMVFLTLAILATCHLDCHAQDLNDQIVSAWREIRHQYGQCIGDYEQSVTSGKNSTKGKYSVKWLDESHGSLHFLAERKVICVNPGYAFELSRSERNDAGWILVDLSDLSNLADEGRTRRKQNTISGVQSFLISRIGLATILDVLDSKTLKVTKATKNEQDGTATAYVSHSIANARPPFDDQSIEQEGIVKLSTKSHFLPLSFEIKFKLSSKERVLDGTCTGTMEYGEEVFPKKIEIEENYGGEKPLTIHRSLTCKLSSRSPLKSDFLLSAYGLPEPDTNR